MRGFVFEIGLVVFDGSGGDDGGGHNDGGGGGMLFFRPSRFLKNEKKNARGNYNKDAEKRLSARTSVTKNA